MRTPPRRPLVPLALAALAGAVLGPLLPPAVWLGPLALALPAAALCSTRTRFRARLVTGLILAAAAGLLGLRARLADEGRRALLALPAPQGPGELRLVLDEAARAGRAGRVTLRGRCEAGARVELDAPAGADPLLPGARVRAWGGWVASSRDGRARLAGQGVAARFRATALEQLEPGRGPLALLAAAERSSRQLIERAARGERAAFLRTLLLGDRIELSPARSDEFRRTGTIHLLSISGLHVGLVAGLALGLGRLLGLGSGPRRWGAGLAILLYSGLAGVCVPVLRSALGGALLCAAPGRGDPWSRLALGLLVVLLWEPASPWQVDLQLSFGVTAAILALARPLERWLAGDPSRRGQLGARLLAGAAVPFLASLPLVWACLGQASLVSLLANLVVVPLCTLTLGLGLAGLWLGAATPGLGALLLSGADLLTGLMFALLERAAALPGGHLQLVRPAPWVAVLAAGLTALGALRREAGRPARTCLAVGALLLLAGLVPRPSPSPGPRLLVRSGGAAALLTPGGAAAWSLGPPARDAWRDEALRRLGCVRLAAAPPAATPIGHGLTLEPAGRAWLVRRGADRAELLLAPPDLARSEARRLLLLHRPRRAWLPGGVALPPGVERLDPGREHALDLAPGWAPSSGG